jgi:hypothetical protein
MGRRPDFAGEASMALVVRAFPILPGKHEALTSFFAELEARKVETDRFYRAYGVKRETAYLQKTPHGDLLIACTELEEVESTARAYAAETAPFHAWFKSKVLEVSGIDPNTHPLGPECRCVFDWQDTR